METNRSGSGEILSVFISIKATYSGTDGAKTFVVLELDQTNKLMTSKIILLELLDSKYQLNLLVMIASYKNYKNVIKFEVPKDFSFVLCV